MGKKMPDIQALLLESWREFNEVVEKHPETKKRLFDPVTGFPTTPLLFPRIKMLLEERGEVSFLCINIVHHFETEKIDEWKALDKVLCDVARILDAITGATLRDSDIIAELMISGSAFVVVLSPPRDTVKIEPGASQLVVEKVESVIREHLTGLMEPASCEDFNCYVGLATIVRAGNVSLERLVQEGLVRAFAAANSREAVDAQRRKERLQDIIEKEAVHTLVQPVFDITDMSVVGYEALSRGPEKSEFEEPDRLSHAAYDPGLVIRLKRLCRKKIFETAADLPDTQMLFLNIEPMAAVYPELREIMVTTLLTQEHIAPERIVLTIAERSAIIDFRVFHSTIKYLHTLGFEIAINDTGVGCGFLQCLPETQPEWLKVDISLMQKCDADEIRAQFVEGFLAFVKQAGTRVIVAGVETKEDLQIIRELGVRYAQGSLLSGPLKPFPDDGAFAHLASL